ncbi:MCE family protein [Thermoleophilia bacterium SCSIO 60948]|nr:MCE family protein [Thermoleophilia bacterium SCSIO 60948]
MAAKKTSSRGPKLTASPTMVGAITVLIAVVAVFLAYNANKGLPFVPTYRVSVEIPNASRLTNANEVRIGGSRVGIVDSIEPVMTEDGEDGTPITDSETVSKSDTEGVIAQVNLKLDETAAPIPTDSVFRVRYRSAFGIKYLEIVRGYGPAAPEGYIFDGTDDSEVCSLPTEGEEQFTSQVEDTPAANGCFTEQTEFDDIYNTFNSETRKAGQKNLVGFGTGFAGRGISLNEAIRALPPAFDNLKPVAQTLSDPDTQLSRFVRELADFAELVAPVAPQNASMFTFGADTFAAITSDPEAFRDTISTTAPALETGIELLPRQRPFLRDFTTLTRELRPGVSDLRPTLPVLNSAIDVGTPVLRRSPALNRRLEGTLTQLRDLVQQPTTLLSLKRLETTLDTAKPLARYMAPVQTVCNYINYWGAGLSNALSAPDVNGFTFRQTIATFPLGPIAVNTPLGQVQVPGQVQGSLGGYSGIQANGRAYDPTVRDGGNFDPYADPITYAQPYATSGQDGDDCQVGQNGYALGQVRVPGQPAWSPANVASDLPGSRGPTTAYFGRDGSRQIKDTRVGSRQPDSWKGLR